MGKIMYEFDTNNPDDRESIKAHQDAMGMHFALGEFFSNTWRRFKKSEEFSEEQLEIINRVFIELDEELQDNGVHIE